MFSKRKFFLFLLVATGFIFSNCQKKEDTTPTPIVVVASDPNVGCTDALAKNYKSTANVEDCSCQYDFSSQVNATPSNDFSQKVLIEEYSGTWCGWCPIGRETVATMTAANAAIIGVEVHSDDELANPDDILTPLRLQFGSPSFPTGLVNRRKSVIGSSFIMGNSEWQPTADDILKNPRTANGIAIDSKLTGNSLQVLTHLKFQTPLDGNFGLGIYLVENDVSGYSQVNYLSHDAQFKQYAAYNQPVMITDAKFQNVARVPVAPITGGMDIPAAATKDGKVFQKLFQLDLPKNIQNAQNCYIIAFIINRDSRQIVNVQSVKIGGTKDWE